MTRSRLVLFLSFAGILVAVLLARTHNPLQVPPAGRPPAPADSAGRFQDFRAPVMGTEIQVVLPAVENATALAETVFAVFREVDARMSEWKPTSPLSAVNAAAGKEAVAVPADLREVLHRSLEFGDLTEGAFDVTWAALWGLWDFKAAEPAVPDRREVARRVALVDYRKIRIDDAAGTVFLPEGGMKIGLGGMGKGYALDRAAASLRANGFTDFLLVVGQVYAGGTKEGSPWRVGIRDPRGEPGDFFATLDVSDASVSTSGDYESFFMVGGVRYHHIIDPRTGMPSRGLRSATVISADATLADALSTAIMVLGPSRGLALAESLGVQAVLVDPRGQVSVTAGLGDRLRLLRAPMAGP